MTSIEGRPDPLHLAEYVTDASVALTEAERRPTLTTAGRARLDDGLADPDAPAWTHQAGDRLTAEGVGRAARLLLTDDWLDEHLALVRTQVPAYRNFPGALTTLTDFPLVDREDLIADLAAFVPRGADLDLMVQGTSSGSTGHSLLIPDHLEEVARTFTLLRSLVAEQHVEWRPDVARMALAYLVRQRRAYTYASTLSGFGETLMARLNVDDRDWPRASRNAFLRRHSPQVVTASPAALSELLDEELFPAWRPLALVSGATELSSGLRADLTAAYGCPVLDVYGLHETRPIAVSADGGPHVLLDRRVLVEVLDSAGDPVPDGQRGELVVTAGENPLLPLVRYRTGDFGRMVDVAGRRAIADLEGRASVDFLAGDGTRVPSVDLTQLLQASGAHGWTVRQRADGSVDVLLADPGEDRQRDARVCEALEALLARSVVVEWVPRLADLGEGKPRRYRSDCGSAG